MLVREKSLETDTIVRMEEIFGGQSCCRCGKDAERFKVINRDQPDEYDRYYCGDCFDEESGANGKTIPAYLKEDRYRTYPTPSMKGNKISLSD